MNLARGRNWISFTGTAAQVNSAFGTEIHRYNVNGELHYANVTSPLIPATSRVLSWVCAGCTIFVLSPWESGGSWAAPDYNSSTLGPWWRPVTLPRYTTSTRFIPPDSTVLGKSLR